jgi:hypothetical protein
MENRCIVCNLPKSAKDSRKKDRLLTGGVTKFSEDERKNLEIDAIGLYSATNAIDAAVMSNLIARLPGLSEQTLKRKPDITDGCACCGSNLISFAFCGKFRCVSAVELDPDHFIVLCDNFLKLETMRKIEVLPEIWLGSYLDHMTKLKQDVVFLDPPWGGSDYKNQRLLSLYLGKRHLADIIHDLCDNAGVSGTRYIVLKLPLNFDFLDMCTKLGRRSRSFFQMRMFKQYSLWCLSC